MNILTTELSWNNFSHLIPHMHMILGKSMCITVSWLNLEMCIRHVSTDYRARFVFVSTPSVTLRSYPSSAYLYTLEISAFGYTYRKSIIRDESKEVSPFDNTPGFVTQEWFEQFRDSTLTDFMDDFDEMIKKLKDYFEQKNNE